MGSTAAGPTGGTAPEGPGVPRRPGAARVKPGAARLGTRGTQGRAAGDSEDSGDAGPSGRAGLRSLVCSLAAPGKAAGATANAPFVSKTAGTNLESTVRAKGRHKGQILNDATHGAPGRGTFRARKWNRGGRGLGERRTGCERARRRAAHSPNRSEGAGGATAPGRLSGPSVACPQPNLGS